MSLVNPSFVLTTSVAGALTVANGTALFVLPKDCDLVAVAGAVTVAPTGASILLNVAKNGTKVLSGSARPAIAAGATVGVTPTPKDANAGVNVITPTVAQVPAIASFAAGDIVRVDVDQIGSGTAGSNLSVTLEFRAK